MLLVGICREAQGPLQDEVSFMCLLTLILQYVYGNVTIAFQESFVHILVSLLRNAIVSDASRNWFLVTLFAKPLCSLQSFSVEGSSTAAAVS